MRPIDADLFDKDLQKYSDISWGDTFYTIEYIRDMLEDAPTVNSYEWISVEDRLPDERDVEHGYYDPETLALLDIESQLISDDVLVVVKDTEREHTFVAMDCTVDGKWQNWDNGYYAVTHWIPLPTPPTEKEN